MKVSLADPGRGRGGARAPAYQVRYAAFIT
jgi:hypothetical protein